MSIIKLYTEIQMVFKLFFNFNNFLKIIFTAIVIAIQRTIIKQEISTRQYLIEVLLYGTYV